MINALDLLNFVAKNTRNEMIDELKLLNYIQSAMNQSVGMRMAAKLIMSNANKCAENVKHGIGNMTEKSERGKS